MNTSSESCFLEIILLNVDVPPYENI